MWTKILGHTAESFNSGIFSPARVTQNQGPSQMVYMEQVGL